MPEQHTTNTTDADKQQHDWRYEAHRIAIVTRIGIIGLYRSQLPRMAAALAYRTIFSIIPVMAIGLLIFGSIVSEEQVEAGVRRVLSFSGVSQITAPEIQQETQQETQLETQQQSDLPQNETQPEIEPETQPETQLPPAEPDPTELDNARPDAVTPSTLPDDPFASPDLEQLITDLINRVNTSIRNVPTGWIALTSGLVLLYAAMSMLIEIEKSFNQLCGAPSGRPWLRRIMLYWTILSAGSIMLAATFLAGDAFTRWVISFAGQDSFVGAVMAGYGVSVLISTILLLGAYTIIPNTRIHFRTALAGAFFAAILWELGKLGFTTYLRYTTTYAKFYGSIAILPLFLLWVYLTWLIVLFGIQASYALQNFSRLVKSKLNAMGDENQNAPTLLDPLVALSVAQAIQAAFNTGKPITADEVASVTNLHAVQASEVVTALQRGGFIHRVDRGDRDDAWTPARPADQIPLDEILRCAQKLDAFRTSNADDLLPESILNASIGSCSGKSLADLTPTPPQETPGESAPA
ncbi:MAG: hypothetical protein CMJ25_03865 [Phycisphaerae bacterium]|nr:hypothetical protein [Phycisphaerae bacterium]